jgi:hypothetical protein
LGLPRLGGDLQGRTHQKRAEEAEIDNRNYLF